MEEDEAGRQARRSPARAAGGDVAAAATWPLTFRELARFLLPQEIAAAATRGIVALLAGFVLEAIVLWWFVHA